ncbi:MAG: leucine-rich repeat domain-containing protein [Clostridia bacterium]|nr:leucine-rich repeat domain-containing protein [Clostridia bacterium]
MQRLKKSVCILMVAFLAIINGGAACASSILSSTFSIIRTQGQDGKIGFSKSVYGVSSDAIQRTSVMMAVYDEQGNKKYSLPTTTQWNISESQDSSHPYYGSLTNEIELPNSDYYKVEAVTESEGVRYVDVGEFDVRPVDQIPETIKLTQSPEIKYGDLCFSWNAVPEASYYKFYTGSVNNIGFDKYTRFTYIGDSISTKTALPPEEFSSTPYSFGYIVAFNGDRRLARSPIFTYSTPADYEISFKDANLETCVRKALNKPNGILLKSDVQTITELHASNMQIKDLSGIHKLSNLSKLDLSRNQIIDTIQLSNLNKLTELNLSSNQIQNVFPLSSLYNLEKLYLNNNNIDTYTTLQYLKKLSTLYLAQNPANDFSPVTSYYRNLIDRDFDLNNLSGLYINDQYNLLDIPLINAQGEFFAPLRLVAEKMSLTTEWDAQKQSITFSSSKGILKMSIGNTGYTFNDQQGVLSNPPFVQDGRTFIPLKFVVETFGGTYQFSENSNIISIYSYDNSPVVFMDANLEAVVRKAVNKKVGAILKSDAQQLLYLEASSSGIVSLEGIQHLSNLTYLNIGNNSIQDLSPLSSLTQLSGINLYGNKLTNISDLSGLGNLTYLNLGLNEITDISPLKSLTTLKTLDLCQNEISELSALSNLSGLNYLSLGDNKLTDISPLSTLLDLQSLYLYNNNITSINGLEKLQNIENINLSYNLVSDITPLVSLKRLVYAYLNGNMISDISAIHNLVNLQALSLDNNQVKSITSLKSLIGLTSLYLSNNKITDISVLTSLKNLQTLFLGNNPIMDFSPVVSYYHNLQTKDFKLNKISGYLAPDLISDNTFSSTVKFPMPTAKWGHGQAEVNGKIYVMGGHDEVGNSATLEEYDIATDTWKVKANLLTPRRYLGAAAVNGKLYTIGGFNGTTIMNTVEEYDPANNLWVMKSSMPTARDNPGVAVVNGKIYALGGWGNHGPVKAVEEFDPSTGVWTTKASMLNARTYHAVSVANNKIYVFGGNDENGKYIAEIDEYDPAADTWTTKKASITPRRHLAAGTLGNKIYIAGGSDGNNCLNIVEEYDIVLDKVEKKSNLQSSKEGLRATTVDGKLYLIGGAANNINMDIVEVYASPACTIKSGFKVEIEGTGMQASTNADGYFEIYGLGYTSEGYTLKITKPTYLTRYIGDVWANSQIGDPTAPVDLWVGDMPWEGIQNNAVNIQDILEIIKYFNSALGDGKFNPTCDLNKDNAINMEDILTIIKHFNTTSAYYPVII